MYECENVNDVFTAFLDKFSQMYQFFFLIKKLKLNWRDLKKARGLYLEHNDLQNKDKKSTIIFEEQKPKSEKECKKYKTLVEMNKKHPLKKLLF